MERSGQPDAGGTASSALLTADTLRQVFDASPSAMVMVAGNGVLRLANLQAERLFGYPAGELVGRSVEDLVPARFRREHPDHRRSYFGAPVVRAMGEGRDLFGMRRDGSEVPIEIGLNPIRTEAGLFVLAAIVDISARKRSEEQLRASLLEKETLLREIHHRVKNNMQVVSSLLSLQMSNVDDPRHRALFEECQTRVRTMALIHEKLYSTGNLASLDGAEYMRDLLQMLVRSYLPGRTGIALDVRIAPFVLDVQVAVPVGLILHELVANSFKHAFAGRPTGTLRVQFQTRPAGACELEVADDGVGLPGDFAPDQARGIGFRMVRGLVRQLDGTMAVHRESGTRFVLTFPQIAAGPSPAPRQE
jgi:PAS domain S-box-containing protein